MDEIRDGSGAGHDVSSTVRRSFFWVFTVLLLAYLTSGPGLNAKAPTRAPSDPAKTYALTGTVINSVTEEPINRALVQVAGGQSVMTGSDGSFEFTGIPDSQFSLVARKPGFFSDSELHPGRQPLYFNAAEPKGPIVLKLTPQGVIIGRITDSDGEPIENTLVALYLNFIQDGRQRWARNNQATTNENGEFRIAGLRPGEYLLSDGPSLGNPAIQTRFVGTAKRGFSKVYYAGATERKGATPISIAPGQHAEIAFPLNAVPVHQVSGRIVGAPPNVATSLQVLTRDGDDASSLFNSYVPLSGSFRMSLPQGVFTIRSVTQFYPNGQTQNPTGRVRVLRAEASVNVTSDLDNIVLPLAPAPVIPTRIRTESTKPDSVYSSANFRPNLSLHLIPQDLYGNEQWSQPDSPENPVPVLRGLEAGDYWVQIENGYPGYVQSLRCGSQDLTREMLTIAPGQHLPPIEIVIRDDAATLSASLRSGAPITGAGAWLVLVGSGNPQTSVRTLQVWGANPELNNLAPGDYTVYAFDNVENLEYRNPEVLGVYSSRAAHVTLAPNGKTNVVLDLIRAEE